jgi:hypothetical protein
MSLTPLTKTVLQMLIKYDTDESEEKKQWSINFAVF